MTSPGRLREMLLAVQRGEVAERDVVHFVHRFGEEGFLEAKPIVEALLDDPDPGVREMALSVLTLHWQCREHEATCVRVLRTDADSDNRRMAVSGLGSLCRNTRKPEVLRQLLDVFEDESEEWDVRDTAYSAILCVLGRPLGEQPTPAWRLDYGKDVDWTAVHEARLVASQRA